MSARALAARHRAPFVPRRTGLTIADAHDPAEQDADRAAGWALRPERGSAIAFPGPRQREAPGGQPAPVSVGRALEAPGRPLPGELRRQMEQGFGHDFSRVRVHNDAQAQASAREIGAQAYIITGGPDRDRKMVAWMADADAPRDWSVIIKTRDPGQFQ